MKISVIIPCYNERETIEKIVHAVRASPVERIEIIIVDDASTDGTVAILTEKVARIVDKSFIIPSTKERAPRSAQVLPPPPERSS